LLDPTDHIHCRQPAASAHSARLLIANLVRHRTIAAVRVPVRRLVVRAALLLLL
jgi:hypothetical protein